MRGIKKLVVQVNNKTQKHGILLMCILYKDSIKKIFYHPNLSFFSFGQLRANIGL